MQTLHSCYITDNVLHCHSLDNRNTRYMYLFTHVDKAEAPIYVFTFYKTLECLPHCFVQTKVSRKYRYYVSLKILQYKYSLSQLWAAIELTSALKITTALVARPWTCLKMIKRNRYPLLAVKAQLIFTVDRYMVYNIHNNSTAAYHAWTLGGG